MSRSGANPGGRDAVEALLEQAAPRPVPPAEDVQRVRDAVYAEWQATAGKRRSRRRLTGFSLAASVVLAAAVVFNMLRVDTAIPVGVANIDRIHGTVYVLGDRSRLDPIGDRETVRVGQVIETAEAAGIGLEWNDGGSLRVDSNTRIEFLSEGAVRLEWGRIYFDSRAPGPELAIDTQFGSVVPVGTQYMAAVDSDTLSVSVREGEVKVSGTYYDESVTTGYRMQLKGSARPATTNFPVHGDAWQWIETISPAAALDGDTIHEFLVWVCRETGLILEYEGEAETLARAGRLVGTVDRPPREELRLRMLTADLAYLIDGGTLKVFTDNADIRP